MKHQPWWFSNCFLCGFFFSFFSPWKRRKSMLARKTSSSSSCCCCWSKALRRTKRAAKNWLGTWWDSSANTKKRTERAATLPDDGCSQTFHAFSCILPKFSENTTWEETEHESEPEPASAHTFWRLAPLKPCARPTSQIIHQDPQNSLIMTPNQFYKQRIMYLSKLYNWLLINLSMLGYSCSMNVEDHSVGLLIWQWNLNFLVQTTRAQQCMIKCIWPIGGHNHLHLHISTNEARFEHFVNQSIASKLGNKY